MTTSEEMYLVSIARLNEDQPSALVPLRRLAEQLEVQPVSANQMVRKLEAAGLVSYTPYQGVELTVEGREAASLILRHRRLWQVFLVERLKISPAEADILACELEHIMPVEAGERLADFLGKPSLSPEGKPIPPSPAGEWVHAGTALAFFKVGESGCVMQLDGETAVQKFLASEGVAAGTSLRVVGAGDTGSVLVHTGDGKLLHLSKDLTRRVYLRKSEN